jgi:hypothetical protein
MAVVVIFLTRRCDPCHAFFVLFIKRFEPGTGQHLITGRERWLVKSRSVEKLDSSTMANGKGDGSQKVMSSTPATALAGPEDVHTNSGQLLSFD